MLFIMAAIAIAAGWNFIDTDKFSDLILTNIEALASKPIEQKYCPGGRHLCAWVNQTTYYDRNGEDDI